MLHEKLMNPRSIVVVGGSNHTSKPGGKVLENLIKSPFTGDIFVLNPKEDLVQGIHCYRKPGDLPGTDLAILSIPAALCPETVEFLAREKAARGFIILSAGFSEESEEGASLERSVRKIADRYGASLIGPNVIGLITPRYHAVFTVPVPDPDPLGCDFISGSGATAVFIMETAIPRGLGFSHIFSVGNSAQTGLEDVLEYLDEHYVHGESSALKILYLEQVSQPQKLLRHARSLIGKGCRIAAIKAGFSEAGSRAAASHTGAMASSDTAVDALFRKAGIIRCHSRSELATLACVLRSRLPEGDRFAVITHAGGPAVMLTDALSSAGMKVPPIEGPAGKALLEKLHPGSSVKNPIDFLATGTAEQLGYIIDTCDRELDGIDAMAVIFGSPGLFPVDEVYDLLLDRMKNASKPIYPVLPSVINAAREIQEFTSRGGICFPDEVELGRALAKVMKRPLFEEPGRDQFKINTKVAEEVLSGSQHGFLTPFRVAKLLDAAGIPRVPERIIRADDQISAQIESIGYPVVMKVMGPVHKSDPGGVILNVGDFFQAAEAFGKLMSIEGAGGVLVQPMIKGIELFAGVSREPGFGHLLITGMGGIFIEIYKDISTALVPLSPEEAMYMIRDLKGFKILEGARGQTAVDLEAFADILVRLSALAENLPEIMEMDINPLMANEKGILAVDARIRWEPAETWTKD